ncbi:MAG: hypothetical protein H0V91_15390 [Flavisolibacter sp.]|jgi:hypothetical protein|nr:hypothetical protein [Flavisolibacter sp.]
MTSEEILNNEKLECTNDRDFNLWRIWQDMTTENVYDFTTCSWVALKEE